MPIHAGIAAAVGDAAQVDRVRMAAGLPALQPDAALTRAAAQHAAYLDRHRIPGQTGPVHSAHRQEAGDEGFSGETPAARALDAGYPHREVLENVSMGYPDPSSAMAGLMAAIYHRLTFLDLEADQLGVAVGERSRVFMLGRSDLVALCADPPDAARHRRPVDCLGQAMERAHYEALCADLPDAASFVGSHPVSCPNGVRLDAAFMARVCDDPPPAARFEGYGRYYAACENGTRLDAAWFDALCEQQPAGATYHDSGSYYTICDESRRVRAEWFEDYCAHLPANARYAGSGRFRRPCADGVDVRVEYLDTLDAQRRAGLPEVVVWPPADHEVEPAFFVEDPDPLPDLAVSGYPVSIQFNPARAADVRVTAFRLFRGAGDPPVEVERTRLFDRANDPNGVMGTHEFALFPLDRLAWNGRYRARVEALVDGEARVFEWAFTTAGDGLPVLTADTARARFVIRSGEDYLLYLPPRADQPYTVLSSRTEHQHGNRVSLAVVDPNTLRVRVDARQCERIRIRFDEGRLVELVPAGCDGWASATGIMRPEVVDRR